MSMGSGNTIVEFFSDDIEFSVWKRYFWLRQKHKEWQSLSVCPSAPSAIVWLEHSIFIFLTQIFKLFSRLSLSNHSAISWLSLISLSALFANFVVQTEPKILHLVFHNMLINVNAINCQNICIGNEVNKKPGGIWAAELLGTARWSARPPSGPSRLSSPRPRQSPLNIEMSDQKNKVASVFITFALASLLASASAAMALWSISGSLASLLKKKLN